MHGARQARIGRRLLMVAIAVCLCIAATGVVGAAVTALKPRPEAAAVDMRGAKVELDPGVTPIPEAASHAVPDIGERLQIPSVGLDVPLGALDEVAGEVTPPGFTSAYWVRNLGVDVNKASEGTVYVVMHALRGGAIGPGNYVTDIKTGKSTVPVGTPILVGQQSYTVTGWRSLPKDQLSHDKQLWVPSPGRLVLITCLIRPDGGLSASNMIITAELAR